MSSATQTFSFDKLVISTILKKITTGGQKGYFHANVNHGQISAGVIKNIMFDEKNNVLRLCMDRPFNYCEGSWDSSKLEQLEVSSPQLAVERNPGGGPVYKIISDKGHDIQLFCESTFKDRFKAIFKIISAAK